MSVDATCHCGRVRVTVPAAPTIVNDCRCSVCYMYGAAWAYYRRGDVTIAVDGFPAPISAADPAATSSVAPLPGTDHYIRRDPLMAGEPAVQSFNRCAHCGNALYWTYLTDIDHERARQPPADARIGVNSRLMPAAVVDGVERRAGLGPPRGKK